MKILWLFTKPPNTENIKLLKRFVNKNDAVVFIQDGVYTINQNIELNCPKYAIKADIMARGLQNNTTVIDYAGLIDLFFEYNKVITI